MDFRKRNAEINDIPILTHLIRTAFQDVAERFNLNATNCPKHPSNCTSDWIEDGFQKGITYYILETDTNPQGCVALERASSQVCYLERLAVLPQARRQGFGQALVAHALSQAAQAGARRVEIGIMDSHAELKAWYLGLGFNLTGTKNFDHLPFEVAFMAKELNNTGSINNFKK
jgi:N-acetylglutamate synthase-like GNAT family acetyltransferase